MRHCDCTRCCLYSKRDFYAPPAPPFKANYLHVQTLATCFYSAVSVVPVTNCVIHGAMPRLPEFSIVTHCNAELIPREPIFDVPWIHTLPPEEYLDTQWTVHEHEFTLTIVMQLLPFNLSFPRIWIRLLPRHLSTSLLFSALLALLCSALHSYTQLHSYTATYSYTAIQLHSYTAIQPHSYTDRQTDRQTDRDR